MNTSQVTRTNRFLARLVRVLEWHRLGQVLPWVVLVFSLLITYQLWVNEREETLQKLQLDFDSRVREAASNVSQRVNEYEQTLRGLQGLFAATDNVVRDKFYSYVSSLHLEQKFPGIQGMGYAQIVSPSEKARHITSLRNEGLPGYVIRPEGEREIYAPSIYVEPFSESNIRSIGIDNYEDVIRRAAMESARDTGRAVISGKLLLEETDGHVRAGFIMFLPVFRNGVPHDTLAERRANITGWVFASSRMDAMMEGIRGEAYSELDIELHDRDSISDDTLMYDSDISKSHLATGKVGNFHSAKRMEVASHIWTVTAHSLPGFDFQLEEDKSTFIAYTGLGTSVLLTLLTLLLVYGRSRALQDAEEIRQSGERYRQMFDENASIAYLLDPETGHIVDANAAALAFWGYTLEELRNMSIAKISLVPGGKIVDAISKVRNSTTHRMEMLHKTKSGEIRDVEVFSGPLTYQGKNLRYSIAHDITARKRAEEAQRLSSTVFNTVENAVLVTNSDNLIVTANPAFSSISGYSIEEVVGKDPRIFSSGEYSSEYYRQLWDSLASNGTWHGEIGVRFKSGEIRNMWLAIKSVRDESGKTTHYVAVFSEVNPEMVSPLTAKSENGWNS